jgi:hypothetical protein
MLGADWRVASDRSAVLDALLDRAGGLNSSQKIKNERQEYKIGTVCVCVCVCEIPVEGGRRVNEGN